MDADKIVMEGWLYKRPRFTGIWPVRWFVLATDSTLSAYSNDPSKISAAAVHSPIPTHVYRLNAGDTELIVSEPFEKAFRTKYNSPLKEKTWAIRLTLNDVIVLSIATKTQAEALKWCEALKKAIKTKPLQRSASSATLSSEPQEAIGSSTVLLGSAPRKAIKSIVPDLWGADENWSLVDTTAEGLEIEGSKDSASGYPSLRARAVVNGTPEHVFKVLMDDSQRHLWDTGIESSTVLRVVSDTCAIVRMETKPFWVGPLNTEPRDLVLLRYWRKEEEASGGDSAGYVVTWQSVEDPVLSPLKEGFIRGKIFAMGFAVSPNKEDPTKSTVRVSCHADPGGNMSYMPKSVLERWLTPFVSRLLGFQKLMESSDGSAADLVPDVEQDLMLTGAEPAKAAPSLSRAPSAGAMDFGEYMDEVNTFGKIGSWNHPEWCATPADEPYKLRGKTYMTDGVKRKTSRSLFHVVAADLNRVKEPMRHCAARSDSPLRKIQAAFPDRHVLCIAFVMPGPPYYLLSMYSVSKPGVIDVATPFGRLWNDFYEGTDEYRNSVFKLVPRCTKGAYIVRKTVGETPALLGKKIKLDYYQGPGYIEVDIDLDTSAIAASILSVFKGYATTLTADLCFVLEGHCEEELPEEIICPFRMIKPVLAAAKQLGEDPDPAETQRLRDLVEKGKRGEVKVPKHV